MTLERILKIIKNRLAYTLCESEEPILEYRVCEKYNSNPKEALKCCIEKQKPAEFVTIKNKTYLKCPAAPIQK